MKTTVFPHMVGFAFLSSLIPLSAQNMSNYDTASAHSSKNFGQKTAPSFSAELPGVIEASYEKTTGELPDSPPAYTIQDAITLSSKTQAQDQNESVAELDILRRPSRLRRVMVSTKAPIPYEVSTNGLETGLAMISAIYRQAGSVAPSSDCSTVALSIEQNIQLDPACTLELVEREISANPACACEIVKSALKATQADVKMVTAIVETAIQASPENMRMISQCAIATVPESITAVQTLLAEIDPNSGEEGSSSKSAKSSKDAKSAKVASVASVLANPLDIPLLPPFPPPPVFPPQVTNVDPVTPPPPAYCP